VEALKGSGAIRPEEAGMVRAGVRAGVRAFGHQDGKLRLATVKLKRDAGKEWDENGHRKSLPLVERSIKLASCG